MSKMLAYHRQAMDLIARATMPLGPEAADEARKHELFQQALQLELNAIEKLEKQIYHALSYSLVHRSAATLALDCGDARLAKRLVVKALVHDPPAEIEVELDDVLEQVKFGRHLERRGVESGDDGMQMSIAGQSVGPGVVLWSGFMGRVGDSLRLLRRIIERKLNKPFREGGNPSKDIAEGFPMLVSEPRAGSFAITLKLGQPIQHTLPGMSGAAEYIDEFMDLMEMVNNTEFQAIQERIPELPYMNNFVGLAKKIAPDGERVNQVGFTAQRAGEDRYVSVTKPRSELSGLTVPEQASLEVDHVGIRGVLRFADATKGNKSTIRIIDEKKKSHVVNVGQDLMSDIVRPMWDQEVVIKGTRSGKRIELKEIGPASDN